MKLVVLLVTAEQSQKSCTSPSPVSHVPASFRSRRDELPRELKDSLQADHLPTNRAVRLPNSFFASPLHLNRNGAEHLSRLLAAELARLDVWESNAAGEGR